MRGIAASLFALMVGLILAPAIVVVEFHADRDRIARELCVQRDVVEDMRTCHGECQLSKRLRALEQEANAPFPMERLESRFEPQAPVRDALRFSPPTPQPRRYAPCEAPVLSRALPVDELVPWRS
jgi:hypothetical protein